VDAWIPALRNLARFPQLEVLPFTGLVPVGAPFESHTWMSIPGVISLPICTWSGVAPRPRAP